MYDLIVIGGGAAGIFAAIEAKRQAPSKSILLLEKSAVLLAKVRVSGGGRCNVTHHCFDPLLLSKNYPRGGKELLGLFYRFQPQDTVTWFESRGVKLKTENDGRMFPVTDSSETIISCLLFEAKKLGVEIRMRQNIQEIKKKEQGFLLQLKSEETLQTQALLLAMGSSSQGYEWAKQWGHTIQKPIPSLFTFNVPSSPLHDLSGISVSEVEISLMGTSLHQRGPILITHFGFSGPAVIKLSAWGAKELFEKNYHTQICINWLPGFSYEKIISSLLKLKEEHPQKFLTSENLFYIPKNLWVKFLELLNFQRKIGDIPHKDLRLIAEKLHRDLYELNGKTTNKEEFVTCGGISLREINFRTMESKICPHLYFSGEILDIDGITGGFNFQNAWTTAFIAAQSISKLL